MNFCEKTSASEFDQGHSRYYIRVMIRVMIRVAMRRVPVRSRAADAVDPDVDDSADVPGVHCVCLPTRRPPPAAGGAGIVLRWPFCVQEKDHSGSIN